MPSPFPGMDPYLEEQSLWPDVHQRMNTYIAEQLQPQLRPRYIACIGERIQLVETITFFDDERHVPYIEIIYRDTGDVVTLIEVLSPANKVGDGRDQYLQKQKELLDTQANLVEIDLLGYGKDTVLARNVLITEPADWRYLVNISRAERRWENALEIYAIPLRERLPRCRIPLRPPDPDAVLDLPAVFTRCYDVGSYDLLIDYSRPPPVPLRDEETAWVAELLQEKGLIAVKQSD